MTTKPFANRLGYTDVEPFEVVRVISDRTVEVRRMAATLAADWRPEMHAGGFSAHCVNNRDQRWTITSDETAPVLRIRVRKDGDWYAATGERFRMADAPRKFHDYNF